MVINITKLVTIFSNGFVNVSRIRLYARMKDIKEYFNEKKMMNSSATNFYVTLKFTVKACSSS